MDIHISNLSPKTTDTALKAHLKNKMAKFGITVFDCQKPKGKTYAFITVPNVAAGEKFLQAHSKKGALFLVQPLLVKRGRETPDQRHVEGLLNRAREMVARVTLPRSSVKVLTLATSCGVATYYHNRLAYHSEWEKTNIGMVVLGSRAMTLATPVYNPDSSEQTTLFRIPYPSVELIIVDQQGQNASMTMILNQTPKAYHLPKAAKDINDILSNLILSGNIDRPLRVRGADRDHERVFAQCLVYRVEFQYRDWSNISSFLHHKTAHIPSVVRTPLPKVTGRFPFLAEMDVFLNSLAASEVPFPVKFQLQRLATSSYLPPSTVQGLIPAVAHLTNDHAQSHVAHALRKLAYGIPFPGPDTTAKDLSVQTLSSQLNEWLEEVNDRPPAQIQIANKFDHLYLVHRATVTPAGVYLNTPSLEPVNRVFREYSEFVRDHFLRVRFQDDCGGDIKYDRNGSLELIQDQWFKKVLNDGIHIAGKTFAFLGFSNSSLKDQSCWFMAPFKRDGVHYDSWGVVKKLGDFSIIHAPAKCAARIGQAFSDTPGGAVDLSRTDIRLIKDVERNGRVFSDGCGTVSPALLRKVWSTYRRSNKSFKCLQVRYAGAKGMVSLDNTLKGDVLCIRDSMLKFRSTHCALEIANIGRTLPFVLNRQLVKILEDLGVPDKSFHGLQDRAISKLRLALSSAKQAASFLERKDVGRGCNLAWLMTKLSEIGIDARDDYFLQCALEAATLAELRLMKHKARIPVEEGYTLYGIMDESGLLRENQIFCKVDGKVKEGRVAITRSPALHPGDIQLAVCVPELRAGPYLNALDNCVAFSKFGERDLPSMLSGGDLDGDIFNVIFDKTLMPTRIYTPADYKRPIPINMYRPMEKEDIADWFIKFMKNDHLGRIAITHVQLADRYPQGTLHPDCLTLAELHSTAVDFQKTGIEVQMSRFPRFKNVKPHFMAPDPRLLTDMDKATGFEEEFIESDSEEDDAGTAMNPDSGKRRQLYYKSTKILGQLYDKIDERSFLREINSTLPRAQGYTAMKKLWAHIQQRAVGIQWGHLKKPFAESVRTEYEELVMTTAWEHANTPNEALTEMEVFMGNILGNDGALPSRRVREDARTMKDTFNDSLSYIVRRITHGEIDALSQVDFDTVQDWADTTAARDQALERAMACLAVSLEPGKAQAFGRGNKRELKSFRYVAGMVALRELVIFEKRNASHMHG